ncbi:MAG: ATP-binding protein, partial [Actinomycetes bacterium]
PCPCGDYHPTDRDNLCSCSEVKRREYRKKISGPIADRIDITRHVDPVRPHEMHDPTSRPESSEEIRKRVMAARDRQTERYAGTLWRLNADVPGPVLRTSWPLTGDADRQLVERVYAGALTRRGATRVHRLAWTVADLSGAAAPGVRELEVALSLRLGDPLRLDVLDVAR